eukprot:2145152-Rhodomonas_salina.3
MTWQRSSAGGKQRRKNGSKDGRYCLKRDTRTGQMPAMVLCNCYAMSGTDGSMLLPGAYYWSMRCV